MVVVKNPIKPTNEIVCDNCNAILRYEVEDKHIGLYGCEVIDCPACGEQVFLSERVARPTFPFTFAHYGNDADALSNPEVQIYIGNVIKNMSMLKAGEFTISGTGDTMVFGLRYEDADYIYVAKNYYEDIIERG